MKLRIFFLLCSDSLTIGGVLLFTALLELWCGGPGNFTQYFDLWPLLPGFIFFGNFTRLYHGNIFFPGCPVGPVEELRRLFFTITVDYLLLVTYLLLEQPFEHSKIVLFVSWILTSLALAPARTLTRRCLKKLDWAAEPVIVAGMGELGSQMARLIDRDWYFGFKIIGAVAEKPQESTSQLTYLGNIDEAVEIARQRKINFLISCLPLGEMQQKIRYFSSYFSHILVVSNYSSLPISWSYPINLHGNSSFYIDNQLRSRSSRGAKLLTEFVFSVVFIIFALPLLVVLAILVKLSSPGPILYRAHRLGQFGVPMKVWKFRTMYVNADDQLEKILNEDPVLAQQWQDKFKLDNDPRITPLGKILRKTSLDELPQLFNVLTGEMALIGPRPIVEQEKVYYRDVYDMFSRVKPGITGLWQVSGRSETSYKRRVQLDMHYIMNWSIWLDYYIFLRTILEVLRCRGAK